MLGCSAADALVGSVVSFRFFAIRCFLALSWFPFAPSLVVSGFQKKKPKGVCVSGKRRNTFWRTIGTKKKKKKEKERKKVQAGALHATFRALSRAVTMAATVASFATAALALAASPGATSSSSKAALFEKSISTADNMNAGVVYTIANPLRNGSTSPPASFPYYGEFFEVLTPPITYNYSEVFWRTIGPVPLPDDIIERYNGSAMAVTGWEVDVVRKLANGSEVSVPCFESYNHHCKCTPQRRA